MELSEKQKGDLIRLFADESLIGVVRAFADDAVADYKQRAYEAAIQMSPDLRVITQYACKGAAFEAIVPLMEQAFEQVMREGAEDAEQN